MTMTLDELIEHTANLRDLLAIKKRQIARMPLDSTAKGRHELAISALEGRVRELGRAAERLRGDEPTLELVCLRPGRPPLIDVTLKAKAVRDLTAPPGDVRA